MIHARFEGENIRVYTSLPDTYNSGTHLYLNFAQAEPEVLAKGGFYPAIRPEVPEGKMLGQIYWDAPKSVFIFPLVEIPVIWHRPDLPIQLVISREVKKDWLEKKQEHEVWGNYPEIVELLTYIGSESLARVQDGDILYIYLSFIYKQHRKILTDNGVVINGEAETLEIEII